jgi:aspartyl-tRNA synthetase
MNQQAEDLLMNAPATITPERYKELHLKPDLPMPRKRDGDAEKPGAEAAGPDESVN